MAAASSSSSSAAMEDTAPPPPTEPSTELFPLAPHLAFVEHLEDGTLDGMFDPLNMLDKIKLAYACGHLLAKALPAHDLWMLPDPARGLDKVPTLAVGVTNKDNFVYFNVMWVVSDDIGVGHTRYTEFHYVIGSTIIPAVQRLLPAGIKAMPNRVQDRIVNPLFQFRSVLHEAWGCSPDLALASVFQTTANNAYVSVLQRRLTDATIRMGCADILDIHWTLTPPEPVDLVTFRGDPSTMQTSLTPAMVTAASSVWREPRLNEFLAWYSMLAVGMFAIVDGYGRRFRGTTYIQYVITETTGLSGKARRRVWQTNDQTRRALAQHLASQPGVLIDWEREPMVPWKGMKFFHGTNYRQLQRAHRFEPGMQVRVHGTTGVVAIKEALPGGLYSSQETGAIYSHSVLTLASEPPPPPEECRLRWGPRAGDNATEEDIDQLESPLTAFTTPYPTKALNYGVHIFTYRLLKGGRELRLLDLRNDYDTNTHGNERLDPFRYIAKLAGIPYGSLNRIRKAYLLQRLFRDTLSVDGAILNNDIEWIWFRPQEVLACEWAHPSMGLTAALRNATEGDPFDFDDYDDESAMSQERFLIASYLADTFGRGTGVTNLKSDVLDKVATTPPRRIKASELPHVRWRLDEEEEAPYTNHYLAWREDMPPVWRAVQLRGADAKRFPLLVYQVNYHAMWRAINPELDDIYMGNAMTEGEHNDALPYHKLLKWMEEINEGVYPELKPTTEHEMEFDRLERDFDLLSQRVAGGTLSPTEEATAHAGMRDLRVQMAAALKPTRSERKPRVQLLVMLPNGRTQLVPPLAAPRDAWDYDAEMLPALRARETARGRTRHAKRKELEEATSAAAASSSDESHKAPRLFAQLNLLG